MISLCCSLARVKSWEDDCGQSVIPNNALKLEFSFNWFILCLWYSWFVYHLYGMGTQGNHNKNQFCMHAVYQVAYGLSFLFTFFAWNLLLQYLFIWMALIHLFKYYMIVLVNRPTMSGPMPFVYQNNRCVVHYFKGLRKVGSNKDKQLT